MTTPFIYKTKPAIKDAIDLAINWFIAPEGFRCQLLGQTVDEGVIYSYEELDLHDERIARVLSDLAIGNEVTMSGNFLRNSFLYWSQPHFDLPIEANVNRIHHDSVCVGEFLAVRLREQENSVEDILEVEVRDFVCSVASCGLKYAPCYFTSTVFLRGAWLNDNVPNWRKHLDLGNALNLSAGETANYVFSQWCYPGQPEVDMAATHAALPDNITTG